MTQKKFNKIKYLFGHVANYNVICMTDKMKYLRDGTIGMLYAHADNMQHLQEWLVNNPITRELCSAAKGACREYLASAGITISNDTYKEAIKRNDAELLNMCIAANKVPMIHSTKEIPAEMMQILLTRDLIADDIVVEDYYLNRAILMQLIRGNEISPAVLHHVIENEDFDLLDKMMKCNCKIAPAWVLINQIAMPNKSAQVRQICILNGKSDEEINTPPAQYFGSDAMVAALWSYCSGCNF